MRCRWAIGVMAVALLTLGPGRASAAISQQSAWASQYANANYPGGNINTNYTIAAGSNRLLVVAVSSTRTAAGTVSCSGTYGTRPLVLAAGDGTSPATWNHSFLFYLDDAGIQAASNTTLAVTCTGGTSYYNWVYAAVYAGVDQASPITDAKNFNSTVTTDSNVGPFSPALTINSGDQAVEIVNLARSTTGTTARTISTWATGWTTAGIAPASIITSGPCATMYIRDRNVTTAASDGSQHTANNTATWDSMTALAMKVYNPTTTIADGTNPSNTPQLCPGGTAMLDAFTLQTNTGTDAISQLTVALTAGAGAKLSSVEIRNDGDTAGYGSVAPATDSPAITTTGLSATTSLTQYKVKVGAKAHASIPVGSYPITGTVSVTGHSGSYALAGTDSGSATVTIDRQAPGTATWGSNSAGYGQVSLAWTNPASDFGAALILRNTVAVADAPTDGSSYSVGGTIGTSQIVYYGTGTSFTDTTVTPGTAYYYAVFARDACTNFSAGVAAGPYTPLAPILPVTVGAATAVADSATQVTVTAPFTGDAGGTPNSSTTVARGGSPSGPFTNVGGCVGMTGASPRVCVDTTVVASTTYYYQVTFSDPDGVNGVNPQVVSVTTPRSPYVLTVGGTAATATTPAPGTSGVVVGRITLQTTSGVGPVRVTGLRLQNAGTAVAGNDVAAVQVYLDAGTLGAVDASDTLLGTAAWDGSRYSLQGLAQDVTTSVTNLLVTMAVSTGATNGRTFLTSLAAAGVTVVAPDTAAGSYASGTGATITATGVVQEGDPTTNSTRPLVTILNPATGGTVTGTFRLQLKVWDPASINNVTNLQWSVNNGSTWPQTINPSTQRSPNTGNYDADTLHAAVYDITVAGLSPGSYSLKARASNDSGATWVMSGTVLVKAVAAPGGAGTLLVRDDSSLLCTDCHAGLKTHSSQNTTRSHGQWATNCRDCHTPHSTTNIGLVATQITPPQVTTVGQPPRAVKFSTRVGDSGSSSVPSASFVNSDNSGPCQVCHTRTQNPSTAAARWQNTGNADTHFDAASGTSACTGCHPHKAGFKGVESTGGAVDPVSYGKCSACHGGVFSTMSAASGSRHAIGNVVGTNDSYVDSGVTWGNPLNTVTPAQRSCVNMCHQDHVHNQVGGASHSYGVFTDATATANRQVTRDANGNITAGTPAATDFNAAATNGGLCLSCHRNPVESGGTPARPAIAKAAYNASAHSFNATTTPAYSWQFTMHDGTVFTRNCTKCHASRTEGNTPVKGGSITAVHGTSDPFLLAGSKNPANAAGFVCYNCHGSTSSPAAGAQGNRSNKNIQSQIAHSFVANQSGHPTDLDSVHDSVAEFNNAAFGTMNAVARHVSCMDCHDPHEAKAGTHAASTNLAGPPLEGAWGAQLSSNPTFWAAPASGNFTKKVIVAGTDVEATLCFKCHSSYYGTLPNAPSGGFQETDTAREFNPDNAAVYSTGTATFTSGSATVTGTGTTWSSRMVGWMIKRNSDTTAPVWYQVTAVASATSLTINRNYSGTTGSGQAYTLQGGGGYHPVLASAGTNIGAVSLTNLSAPWNAARNLMTCSDCHESDVTSDPNGPHGSSAKFILKGPNLGWNVALIAGSGSIPAGTFCLNCHSSNYTGSRFPDHTRGNHNVPCWNCHAAIPHGGPRPGMLNPGAGTNTTNLPAITTWDGVSPYWQGQTSNRLYIVRYPNTSTASWAQNDCGCNGTGH